MTLSRRNFTRVLLSAAALLAVDEVGFAAPSTLPTSQPVPSDAIDGESFAERSAAFIRWLSQTRPDGKAARSLKMSMAHATARLITGIDVDWAVAHVDSLVRKRDLKNDHAFGGHSLMHGVLVAGDRMPAELVAASREYLCDWDYAKPGFSSLNYKLMTAATGFAAAEKWPDFVDATGRDAAGVMEVTRAALYREFDQIVRRNLDEYGAPIYFGTDLAPVRMLAEFGRDDAMRMRARLTLEWMWLNLACHWNQGYHVSTAGRAKYWGSTNTGPDHATLTAACAWLHFGGLRAIRAARTDPAIALWLAYPGTHELPNAIRAVAQQAGRLAPFVHRESVVVPRGITVRQTTYHAKQFSLSSQWEATNGFKHPLFKETRRMVLRWVSEKPSSTFIVANENYRRPYRISEKVKNAFAYGETPFGQVMQHDSALLALYDVPADYLYYRLYAVFPATGSIVQRFERNGWVLCHTGTMLFAFRAFTQPTWGKPTENNDVLYGDARRGGWVLQCADRDPFRADSVDAELQRFGDAICTPRVRVDLAAAAPTARYVALDGRAMEMTYAHPWAGVKDNHRIDGAPIDYAAYPLLDNQAVAQRVDDPQLRIRINGQALDYDFEHWTRTDGGTP
jgi:hypothetical protein